MLAMSVVDAAWDVSSFVFSINLMLQIIEAKKKESKGSTLKSFISPNHGGLSLPYTEMLV